MSFLVLQQALLDEWRAELARKPLCMSEAEACALLEIQMGPEQALDEEVLKAAYRRLARKFHPDKNPTGRERFMAVQKAYERLQAGAAAGQGPQAWRLLLILKVCGRCFSCSFQCAPAFRCSSFACMRRLCTCMPAERLEWSIKIGFVYICLAKPPDMSSGGCSSLTQCYLSLMGTY